MLFKGFQENIYFFLFEFIFCELILQNYVCVVDIVFVYFYVWYLLFVLVGIVISNVVLVMFVGYVFGCMCFCGKWIVMGILLLILLFFGEVMVMSNFFMIWLFGLVDILWGVFFFGVISVMNVLLIVMVCWMIFKDVLDVVIVDGVMMWQCIWYIVWLNI